MTPRAPAVVLVLALTTVLLPLRATAAQAADDVLALLEGDVSAPTRLVVTGTGGFAERLVVARFPASPESDGDPPAPEYAWSPDGRQLAVTAPDGAGGSQLVLVSSVDQVPVRTLIDSATSPPAWSPDGTAIAVGTTRGMVLVAPTGEIVRTVTDELVARELAWAPTGARIAYEVAGSIGTDTAVDVVLIDPDGSDRVQVTNYEGDSGKFVGLSWAPDGSEVVFGQFGGESQQVLDGLVAIAADGTTSRQLTSGTSDVGAVWSPDGTRVAFERDGQIHTVGADGSGDRRVSDAGPYGIDLSWTSTGGLAALNRAGSVVGLLGARGRAFLGASRSELVARDVVAAPVPVPGSTTRLAATDDPVQAALAWSRAQYPPGVDCCQGFPIAAVIARSDDFVDALAAAPLRGRVQRDPAGRPLLLTPSDRLHPDVAAELERLSPGSVTLLGGTAAISAEVEQDLRDRGYAVNRLGGRDRIETAVEIARAFTPGSDAAERREGEPDTFLVRAFPSGPSASSAFADSIAVGPYTLGRPAVRVLVTATDELSAATEEFLRSARDAGRDAVLRVAVVGGRAAVSDRVVEQVRALGIEVERVSGPDRASTAVALLRRFGTRGGRLAIVDAYDANGWASGFASFTPVVVGGQTLPESTAKILRERGVGTPLVCGPLLSPSTCDVASARAGRPRPGG